MTQDTQARLDALFEEALTRAILRDAHASMRDSQTRLDALADAETLCLAAGNYDSWIAGVAGARSVDASMHQDQDLAVDDSEARVYKARYAARAAFRAVPGLRG